MDLPVFGICYGEQTMVAQMGGRGQASTTANSGAPFVDIRRLCLFEGVWKPGEKHQVWMSHGDRIDAIPDGFRAVARPTAPRLQPSPRGTQFYGVQFHPEVVHTPDGAKLSATSRIGFAAAAATGPWRRSRDEAIQKVRDQVGAAV